MSYEWQISCLNYRVASLSAEIQRVADKDHPYSEPSRIYSALLKVIASRRALLRSAQEYYPKSTSGLRGLGTTIEQVVLSLDDVAYLFELAHRVDSARIPFEIMHALSWAAQSLLPEPCRVVVRLDPNYNYSILSLRQAFAEKKWLPYWNAALEGDKPSSSSNVLLIGFPSPEVGSILVHAIAAHELGHQIAETKGEVLTDLLTSCMSSVKQKYSSEITEYISDRAVRRSGVSPQDAFVKAAKLVENELYKISRRWVSELFADLVAARLVGPAFLAAFDRVLLGQGDPKSTHPPSQFRRNLVKRFLAGNLPHIAGDGVWTIVYDSPFDDSLSPELPYTVAREVCLAAFEEICKIVGLIPSPLAATSEEEVVNFRTLVLKMKENIMNFAPPSVDLQIRGERETANMFWLLLYAAWHFRLESELFVKFCQGWEGNQEQAEAVLGNLVLHALQSLELKYKWSEFQPTEGQIGD